MLVQSPGSSSLGGLEDDTLQVCASIQVPHISALFKRSGPRLRVLDKVTLAQACRNDADPRICALRDRVGAWLHSHQDATVEAVNAELHSTALDLFPGKLQHGRIVPWQSEQVGMAVRTMWAAYRTWRSTAKACSKHIWRAWAAYSKFCKAHRAFRRSTRQAKTAWFKESGRGHGSLRAVKVIPVLSSNLLHVLGLSKRDVNYSFVVRMEEFCLMLNRLMCSTSFTKTSTARMPRTRMHRSLTGWWTLRR